MQLPVLPARQTCTLCPLHSIIKEGGGFVGVPSIWFPYSHEPTPGVPVIIFLGRNPGAEENKAGRPFIGDAGSILWKQYITHKFFRFHERATVYLFNTVRCWTPQNAPPGWKDHVTKCFPYTEEDLAEVIRCHSSPPSEAGQSAAAATNPISSTSTTTPSVTLASALPASNSAPTPSKPLSFKIAVVAMGKEASAAAAVFLAGSKKPKSQNESFKNNARMIEWRGHPLLLLNTFHPAYLLPGRNPGAARAVHAHLRLLSLWLDDKLVAPSKPVMIEPRSPER